MWPHSVRLSWGYNSKALESLVRLTFELLRYGNDFLCSAVLYWFLEMSRYPDYRELQNNPMILRFTLILRCRVIVQTVGRQFPTQYRLCGTCGGRSDTGTDFIAQTVG